MGELTEKLLPRLRLTLKNPMQPIDALPLSPSNQLIVAVFCSFRELHGGFRSRDGRSQRIFFEIAKKVFDLNPVAGHRFVTSLTLGTRLEYLVRIRNKKGGTKWSKIKNNDHSSIFYEENLASTYPAHWSVPSGDLADFLKAELVKMTTNGVDVNSIKIYTTTEYVELLGNDPEATRGLIPPSSVEITDKKFALFYLDGERGWRLDMLLSGGTRYAVDSPCDVAKNAVKDFYETSLEQGISQTNLKSRTGTDRENIQHMVMSGFRYSIQKNRHGKHYGIRCNKLRLLVGEEALGSVIMSVIAELFLEPFFLGVLMMLRKACADYGGNIFPSWHPFTLQAITKNYCNGAHMDVQDLVGGFIVWLHAGVGKLTGCEFVVTSHGCHFTPRDGSCLYLRSPDIAHYSVPPKTTGTRCQLGIALAARKNVITGLKQQVEDDLANVEAGRGCRL